MKKGNLEKWEDISGCNNLLFFSQLVNELLFDYSIPSNRISTLNSHYLCLDAINAIQGIEENGVPEGTLKPIMEELYTELKKDPVFSESSNPLDFFVKNQNGKFSICNRVADMNYKELKNTARAINNSLFIDNKYYFKLKEMIIKIIKNNNESEQQILFRLTKSLLTELKNKGYTTRYLYMQMNELYWNPFAPIESPEAIGAFFQAFDFNEKDYTVILKIDKKEIGTLLAYIDGLNYVEKIPQNVAIRLEKSFIKKEESEAFLLITRRAMDPYGAAERAVNLVDTNSAVYRLYDHRYCYNIADADCVVLDEENTYKSGRNLKAVEHTKKPSSKTITESMDLVNDAIKATVNTGEYNDFVSILNAIRYHSHSLDSSSLENQLLDLWAIFETVLDISNQHTTDRIQQICMYLVPILKRNYLYSLLKQFADDIKNYNEEMYNSIIEDAITEQAIVQRIGEFTLLPKNEERRKTVLEKCDDFPLLKERLSYYSTALKTPAEVHSFVEKHADRVKWQIMRIYRNRNLIIHNGRSMPYLSLLIENLHSYVDDFLAYTIHTLAQKKSIETMCQELFVKECKWNASLPRQKKDNTREDVKYFLSV